MPDYDPEQDAEWRERHPNPSGLEEADPNKQPQEIPDHHHEEGHVDPGPA